MMSSYVSRALRSHTFWRIILFTAIALAFFRRVAPLVPFTGDEPHYLLGAISFVKDGDFNVTNNYANQDYREFGFEHLRPQRPETRPGVLITEHGIGFPALLSGPWRIKKVAGVQYALFLAALLTIFLGARCCDLISGSPWTGTLAALLLGFCPTWLMQARMVYPECTAGFVTVLISLLLIRLSRSPSAQGERVRSFLLGLLFYFPVIHVRYVPLTVPLYLMIPFSPVLRRMRWLYAGFACGAVLLCAVLIRFPEPGSIGATNFAAQESQFILTGAFDRLWLSWFDRNFGLAVCTPWVVLAFWAVVYYLPRFPPLRVGYTESAALAVLGYSLMFGLWVQHPGASVPGRYLCSAVPLMAILVVLWCRQGGSLLNPRTVLVAILLCISVAFVVTSIRVPIQPHSLFGGYRRIFQEYWSKRWDVAGPVASPRPLGIAIVALLTATKLGALILSRSAVWPRLGRS